MGVDRHIVSQSPGDAFGVGNQPDPAVRKLFRQRPYKQVIAQIRTAVKICSYFFHILHLLYGKSQCLQQYTTEPVVSQCEIRPIPPETFRRDPLYVILSYRQPSPGHTIFTSKKHFYPKVCFIGLNICYPPFSHRKSCQNRPAAPRLRICYRIVA